MASGIAMLALTLIYVTASLIRITTAVRSLCSAGQAAVPGPAGLPQLPAPASSRLRQGSGQDVYACVHPAAVGRVPFKLDSLQGHLQVGGSSRQAVAGSWAGAPQAGLALACGWQ